MISHPFHLNSVQLKDRLYKDIGEEEITETGKAVLEEVDVQDVFNLMMSSWLFVINLFIKIEY